MRFIYLMAGCGLFFMPLAPAAETIFSDPEEAATWQWMLERADRKQHIEKDRNGKIKWVGYLDEEKQKGDYYSGSLSLDPDGYVNKLTFNKAFFTNEDYKRFRAFKRLETITTWHNGWDKTQDENRFSGAGLGHLKDSRLKHFNIGGSWFNDEGLAAANTLPSLRELKVYHTRVTNQGVNALRGNSALTYLNLGPQFSQKVSAACLKDVATISNLESLDLNEMLLPWADGLEHLVKLKPTLKKLTCKASYIEAKDLAKLKAALPDVQIDYEPATEEQIGKMRKREAAKAKD